MLPMPPPDATLLFVDLQRGFLEPHWGRRNNPDLEANAGELLAAWRGAGRAVVHVRHLSTEPDSPLRPERPGSAFLETFTPIGDERTIEKQVHSAFIGTPLEAVLREARCRALVIAGLTSDHCVSTTARMAADLGFATWLAGDATAAFDRVGPDGITYPAELVHATSLASLHREFVNVVTTRELVAERRSELSTGVGA